MLFLVVSVLFRAEIAAIMQKQSELMHENKQTRVLLERLLDKIDSHPKLPPPRLGASGTVFV